jgi:DNA-directed RNA polymerase subunit M/transcription elongation factor TFIIS
MWQAYEKKFFEQTGWNHPNFARVKQLVEEEEKFVETPLEIEEGVVECEKCGSKKTFSYQRQTRSADEGFTLFVTCTVCKTSWREN